MGSQVMALKWRPQLFSDMVGQEHVTQTLQNAIRTGRLAHAYIFAGPRGVGKTTTARIFAKALSCRHPQGTEPCNQCDICNEINQGGSLDVIEIDAASVNGIDDIRQLQEQVATYPAKSKYKVYIFDEAHRISKPAFDAFLKTLEEPPAHVIFILASTEIQMFPSTVQSRCQRFEFRAMSQETLLKQMQHICKSEHIQAEEAALNQIAQLAGGSMRDAQRTLDQIVAFAGNQVNLISVQKVLGLVDQEIYLQLTDKIAMEKTKEALQIIRTIIETGKDLEHFYTGWMETFRNILIVKMNHPSKISSERTESNEAMTEDQIAASFEVAHLLSILRLLIEQEWAFRHSLNPSVVLETLVVELCQLRHLSSVGDLLKKQSQPMAEGTVPQVPFKTASMPPSENITEGENALAVEEIQDPENMPQELITIRAQWKTILEKVGEQKKSFQGILMDVYPKDYANHQLFLSCKSEFHRDQIFKSENKALLESIIETCVGFKLQIDDKKNAVVEPAIVSPVLKKEDKTKDDIKKLEQEEPVVAEVLKMFDANVVEIIKKKK